MTSLCEFLSPVVLLGSDSLFAGLAVGPILASWRARAVYALLFGVCDGMATLLGAAVPHRMPQLPAILLYLFAVALIIQCARRSRASLYALPLLFSLDNLAAGNSMAAAPALAMGSAVMAGIGLVLGVLGWRAAIRLAKAGAPA